MAELHDVHKSQIAKFTTWFSGKRARAIADQGSDLEDFKSDRLLDDDAIFNKGDVEALLDQYHQMVMGNLQKELEKTVSLSGAFIAQLLAQAEANDVYLQVDNMAGIEDQGLMDQVSNFSVVNSTPLVPKPRQTLEAVGGGLGGGAEQNIALLQQIEQLQEEKRQISERSQRVEMELSNVTRERAHLSSEVSRLQEQSLGGEAQAGADAAAAQEYLRQLQEMQQHYAAKVAENDQLTAQWNNGLAQSPQFTQLKTIVKQKNAEVQDLKQRMMAAGVPLPGGDEGGCVELVADDDD